eukprot:TRINITY_DN35892_c0_g1_i1.p1 TRINITY_DN35892_c0_g1~~TRINITY_DN35892_c0_g1_i1.p1  ORF type:complete len:223 (-),score=44.21 TRINITY_DN35892_c0_g1_i1:28-696(-)
MDLARIAEPRFDGLAEFPTLNSDAHKALSLCMTQIPTCNPAELSGMPDVRVTYAKASGSLLAGKYFDVLSDYSLMQQLQDGLSCTRDEFEEAYTQLSAEVRYLKMLSDYYGSHAQLISSLGQIFTVALQENFAALLEMAVEGTTTTTTTTKTKNNVILKKLFDVTCALLNVVGACFEVPGLGSDVKMVGKGMVTLSKIANGQESLKGVAAKYANQKINWSAP